MSVLFLGSTISINSSAYAGNQDVRYSPGREPLVPRTDGRGVATFAGITRCVPSVAVQTLNVKTILAILAASGAELPYLVLTDLKWIDRRVSSNAPTIDSGSTAEQAAVTAGILAMTGIEAGADAPAVMSLLAYPTSSDGTTDPVAFTQVAAPAEATAIAPFILDSVALDSTAIAEVSGVSLGIGIDWQIEHGLKPFPQLVRPRASDWTMTIRHRDRTIPRTKADKDSNASFVLKDLQVGTSTRGSQSVTFTVTGMIHQGDAGQTQDSSEITTVVRGRFKTSGSVMPGTWAIV